MIARGQLGELPLRPVSMAAMPTAAVAGPSEETTAETPRSRDPVVGALWAMGIIYVTLQDLVPVAACFVAGGLLAIWWAEGIKA
jgi:hypothetical protein